MWVGCRGRLGNKEMGQGEEPDSHIGEGTQ